MKSKRQNEILDIISSKDIETQEELASVLRSLGYKVTQRRPGSPLTAGQ